MLEDRAVKRSRLALHPTACVVSSAASGELAPLPMRKWPTRLHKLLSRATGPDARANAESQEMDRWIRRLRVHITQAGLPLAGVAAKMQQPESALEGLDA